MIIGIDAYTPGSGYKALNGAVTDAKRVESYLTDVLNVPPANIRQLLNEKATRAGILAAFQGLALDEGITKDESAIVIFYAGHGASTSKPEGWKDWEAAGGQVEMLCPVDIVDGNESCKIDGIPDRTIAALLDKLSQAKGNNIVGVHDFRLSSITEVSFRL